MKTILICSIICICSIALSDNLTDNRGKVYSNVEITHNNPTGIFFFYQNGARRVATKLDFNDLPESVQKKYGYDPEKSAEYKAASNKRAGEFHAKLQLDQAKAVQAAQERRLAEIAFQKKQKEDAEEVARLTVIKAKQEVDRYADQNPQIPKSMGEPLVIIQQPATQGSTQYDQQYYDLEKKKLMVEVMKAGAARLQAIEDDYAKGVQQRRNNALMERQTSAIESMARKQMFNQQQPAIPRTGTIVGNTIYFR